MGGKKKKKENQPNKKKPHQKTQPKQTTVLKLTSFPVKTFMYSNI